MTSKINKVVTPMDNCEKLLYMHHKVHGPVDIDRPVIVNTDWSVDGPDGKDFIEFYFYNDHGDLELLYTKSKADVLFDFVTDKMTKDQIDYDKVVN